MKRKRFAALLILTALLLFATGAVPFCANGDDSLTDAYYASLAPLEEQTAVLFEDPAYDGSAVETAEEDDSFSSDLFAAPEEQAAFEAAFAGMQEEAEEKAESVLSVFVPNNKQSSRRNRQVNVGEESALSGPVTLFAIPGAGSDTTLEGGGIAASDEDLVGAADESVFDLRAFDSGSGQTLNLISAAPNQKENGACWAYTATAAGEAGAALSSGTDASAFDDSEYYLALFAHALRNGEGALEYQRSADGSTVRVNPFLSGGTSYETGSLLAAYFGPAAESSQRMPIHGTIRPFTRITP